MSRRPAPALRTLLAFVALAVAVQIGFRLWVRPGREAAMNRERDRVVRLTADLRAREEPEAGGAERREADILRADLERTVQRVETLHRILGAGTEASGILDSIAGIASEEGLRLRRFAPELSYPMGPFRAWSATVEAEGRYFDFLRFLDRIAGLEQAVVIDEFDLSAPVDPGGLLTGRFVAMAIAAESEPADPAAEPGGRE